MLDPHNAIGDADVRHQVARRSSAAVWAENHIFRPSLSAAAVRFLTMRLQQVARSIGHRIRRGVRVRRLCQYYDAAATVSANIKKFFVCSPSRRMFQIGNTLGGAREGQRAVGTAAPDLHPPRGVIAFHATGWLESSGFSCFVWTMFFSRNRCRCRHPSIRTLH
jgi:hypothetical protein